MFLESFYSQNACLVRHLLLFLLLGHFRIIIANHRLSAGIIIALMAFGCTVYLMATEFISAKKSKGEVLLFRRGAVPAFAPKPDAESQVDGQEVVLARTKTIPDAPASIQKQTAIFHWDGVNYDIKIKKEPRRLLDDVDGWVKRKMNPIYFLLWHISGASAPRCLMTPESFLHSQNSTEEGKLTLYP
jgi:hypothetical protein